MNMTIERGKIGVRSCRRARGLRLGLLGLACLAAVSVAAPAQTYIEFNAPGAFESVDYGTFPRSINTAGVIAGYYDNQSQAPEGFVRSASGAITSFQVPGAYATGADSMNSAGVIAGSWEDVNAVHHGYVRSASGTITSFDVCNAGANTGHGTFPRSINTAGVIAGNSVCKGSGAQGFVRSASGAITTFAVPGAATTVAYSINTGGAIAGYYDEIVNNLPVYHGFARSASGTITSFDAPGAGTSPNGPYPPGTWAQSINDAGVIVGYYVDACEGYHGFVRSAEGTITTLDAPGAGTCLNPLYQYPQGTIATSINDDGVIVGYYIDPNLVYHGFMVSASGAITTLDAPGAGTTNSTGTFASSINNNGVIAGYYSDPGYAYHGFQLTP